MTDALLMNTSTLVAASGDFVDSRSSDQWFAALDQRKIGSGSGNWVVQVQGVHSENDGVWIQISSSEDPFATIVLHLTATTSVGDVLAALERHDHPVDGRPAIIDLAAWTTRVVAGPACAAPPIPHRAH